MLKRNSECQVCSCISEVKFIEIPVVSYKGVWICDKCILTISDFAKSLKIRLSELRGIDQIESLDEQCITKGCDYQPTADGLACEDCQRAYPTYDPNYDEDLNS